MVISSIDTSLRVKEDEPMNHPFSNKKYRTLLALCLAAAVTGGAWYTESIAEAYHCSGSNTPPTPCKCGSIDAIPGAGPYLPPVEWANDCNDLAAQCASWNSTGGLICSYTPAAGTGVGGTCDCLFV